MQEKYSGSLKSYCDCANGDYGSCAESDRWWSKLNQFKQDVCTERQEAREKHADEMKAKAYKNKADYYLDKAFNSDDFYDRQVPDVKPCTENDRDTGWIKTFEFKDKWADFSNKDKLGIIHSIDKCECLNENTWSTASGATTKFNGCSDVSKTVGDETRLSKGKKWCYTKGYCGYGYEESDPSNKSQDPKVSKMWRYCKNKKYFDLSKDGTEEISCEDARNTQRRPDEYECVPYKDEKFGGIYQSFKEKIFIINIILNQIQMMKTFILTAEDHQNQMV